MGASAGSGRYVRARLSAMMVVYYFGLGGWAVTLGAYLLATPDKGGLGFSTFQVGWIYSTFALGGLIVPPFLGLLADRLFSAERVLAVACAVQAVLLTVAGWWCDNAAGKPPDEVFAVLFPVMLVVCLGVQAGLTLTSVVSLRNLADPSHQFPRVRLFGTVGWILSGNVVGLILTTVSPQPLYLAALAAAVGAVVALALPHTPPKGTGRTLAEAFGVPALGLLRDPSFVVFLAVAFVSSAMNQFYGVYSPTTLADLDVKRPASVLTVGQVVEVGCMFAIPLFHPKRHMKLLMLLGLAGWVLRGAVFAVGWVPGIVAVGVPMHGWSYALYFIVAATYIDREAPGHLRASAQAIVAFVASGAAPWAGNMLAAWVVERHTTAAGVDWSAVWLTPLAGCTIALVAFWVLFRPPAVPAIVVEPAVAEPGVPNIAPDVVATTPDPDPEPYPPKVG